MTSTAPTDIDEDAWPPRAAPDTLLGQLQRGLGSGARAALAATDGAAEAVLESIAIDQRWDGQIDDRADYYARLVLALRINVNVLEGLVRAYEPQQGWNREPLALKVLGRLVQLGNEVAVSALRREAMSGRYWVEAIDGLVLDAAADPVPGWEARVVGVLEAVVANADAWLDDAPRQISSGWEPWETWRATNVTIRSVLDDDDAATAHDKAVTERREARGKEKLAQLATAELLSLKRHGGGRWTLARELEARTTPEDEELLLAAARDTACPARALAIRALALRGHAGVLPVVRELSNDLEPSVVQREMKRAFEALPLDLTRATAQQWLADEDGYRRRTATGAYAEHGATPEDYEPLCRALERELDRGDYADGYLICNVAKALEKGRLGAALVLRRAFREMSYSYGRQFVADALAEVDPDFPATLAVDCLWDAEDRVREVGAGHASLSTRVVRERLHELAADVHEEPAVRALAAARLRGNG